MIYNVNVNEETHKLYLFEKYVKNSFPNVFLERIITDVIMYWWQYQQKQPIPLFAQGGEACWLMTEQLSEFN